MELRQVAGEQYGVVDLAYVPAVQEWIETVSEDLVEGGAGGGGG